MARKDALVHLHLLQGGIVFCCDNQVDAILEILVDYLDSPRLSIKHQIENVGTSLFGVQAHTISCFHLPTSNSYRCWRWIILTWKSWKIPTPATDHAFSPSLMGRRSRMVPCIFMNCSGVS